MRRSVFVCLAPLMLVAQHTAHADVVTDWNAKAIGVAKTAGASTNAAPRALAIVHIAIHNAVATVTRRYERYGASTLAAVGPTDLDVATSAAAHRALVALFATSLDGGVADASTRAAWRADIDAYYEGQIAAVPAGAPKSNGIILGEAAATSNRQSWPCLGHGARADRCLQTPRRCPW
jgi:hypothetical protein